MKKLLLAGFTGLSLLVAGCGSPSTIKINDEVYNISKAEISFKELTTKYGMPRIITKKNLEEYGENYIIIPAIVGGELSDKEYYLFEKR